MQFDAIILAGGKSGQELKKISPYDNEAFLIIGSYPMIYYVYSSLRASNYIRNIIISGPVESLKALFAKDEQVHFAEPGEDIASSLTHSIDVLERMDDPTERILILPSDIPFITPGAINDFIMRSMNYEADFFYPLTSKEVNEKKYPEVKRTYFRLREGIFTGGNLFLVNRIFVRDAITKAREIITRRKNPLAIARLFGLSILLRYLFKHLTIESAEKTFEETFGFKGKAIISPFAEVGVDVDKPSDLILAQKHLAGVEL